MANLRINESQSALLIWRPTMSVQGRALPEQLEALVDRVAVEGLGVERFAQPLEEAVAPGMSRVPYRRRPPPRTDTHLRWTSQSRAP